MGEFEDLLARARSGDDAALDELESKFSGSALREANTTISQERDSLKSWREQNLDLVRKAKVSDVVASIDESLRSLISVDDFKEVDPDEITTEKVQSLAQTRMNQKNELRLAAAKEAGFESVEAYDRALETVKQMDDTRRRELEALGGAASGGGEASSRLPSSAFDTAKKDFDLAKQLGNTDDEAMGEFIHTLLATQRPKTV